MYPTSTYVAQRIARDYTRDRISDADTRRAARVAKGRRAGSAPVTAPVARPRHWWSFPARATTA
jgi:hypothetical protein